MYRLITFKSLCLNNIKLLSKNLINIDNKCAVSQCRYAYSINGNKSFLSKDPLFVDLKSYSTHRVEALKERKSKRRHKYGKYVELLEVGLTAKQIKAKVRSLKSKKLSDFITKSDYLINRHSGKYLLSQLNEQEKLEIAIAKPCKEKPIIKVSKRKKKVKVPQPIEYQKFDLDMLDNSLLQLTEFDDRPLIFFGKEETDQSNILPKKVDQILGSFQNFKDMIETVKTENEIEFSTPCDEAIAEEETELEVLPEQTIEISKNVDDTKSNKKERRYKSKHHKSLEQENLAKQKTLLINLTSYINVCVSSGSLNRGLSTLLNYRQKCKKIETPQAHEEQIIPIDIYNILLHGYAQNGDLHKIENILKILNEDNVKLNHQTFAAIFECLGRVEENEINIQHLQNYKQMAENLDISLNNIIDKSKFQYDQFEIVLDAIRRIEPNFSPIFTPPNILYTNHLLNKLNNDVRSINESDNLNANNIINDETRNSRTDFTTEQLATFCKEQLVIELEGYLTVNSIEKSGEFEISEEYREKFKDLNDLWRSQICAAINRDLNALHAQMRYKNNGLMTYYTYLKCLNTGQYADIILSEIRRIAEGSETYSPTTNQLYNQLGQKVQAKYQIELKKQNGVLEKMGDIYSSYCKKLESDNSCDNSRQLWQRLVYESRSYGPSMDICENVWPNHVLYGVGQFLYKILIRDIKIDANILKSTSVNTKNNSKISKNLLPAFYTLFRNHGRLVKEEVKPHPVLARLLRASKQKTLTFNANQIPMLCPPQPWSTPVNGGYILTKSELIRLPYQAIQQWNRINESNPEDLYPALDSLNQLASIPWRVNTDILDVIAEVFNNGGDSKLDVPKPPNSLPPLPSLPKQNSSSSNSERAQLYKQKLAYRRKQAEMYSLWCDTLYRLSLANHYRDKVFWLPHNMDFRGRVYPIPPHLNHLGSDLARSMLIFNKKKPLGPDGFTWLKLHCINLTGLKKRDSIRERLLYAEEIMDEILDSADNPLNGRKWWAKSDEPWQTLSCCIEIAKVSRSPDPENYMSNFPIHQDGSCNGLQHYAALGRDKAGAYSVNLNPSELPQDVYSAIAALVESGRKSDETKGLQIANILDGYIKRKVIKQTVMTTVYGVTRFGARLQIARQLKDIDEFPKEWVWPASTYLTTKTFESLRLMFTSAKEIQDWFTECARLISSVCSENVEWTTPLGLPVVQPYNRTEANNTIKVNKSKACNEKMALDMYEKPNIMKQRNAFPPNFIHSLDSSHMMLTSLHCERNNLTFISVHDCFWTHACTVPDMNKICREQFVALHSEPILEDLSKFLVKKYSYNERVLKIDNIIDLPKRKLNNTLQKLPKKGNFDLRKVLKSVYFFS